LTPSHNWQVLHAVVAWQIFVVPMTGPSHRLVVRLQRWSSAQPALFTQPAMQVTLVPWWSQIWPNGHWLLLWQNG
jgi:hypothetical protein